MNSTTMLITIAILIVLYPFVLYFQLNSFKQKLNLLGQEIEVLLKRYGIKASEKLEEEIHIKRRAYNALVRANNHKLKSKLSQLLAKKYNFESKKIFEFQGR